jgi:hypothetical protein
MKRIIIICNKSWETDAVLSALFNDDIRYPGLDYTSASKPFKVVYSEFPWKRQQGTAQPRAIFQTVQYSFEIWCLQNVMTLNPNPADFYYYSRSIQKATDFPKILQFAADEIQLVVAFGTAGVPSEVTKNGGVVVGSHAFVYDANSPLIPVKYTNPQIGQLVDSAISQDFFDQLNSQISRIQTKLYFETTALSPPINSSSVFQLFADKNITALSDVNVGSYAEYKTADQAAIQAYANLKASPVGYSVETTHGLIRLESHSDRFIFVSAITDRDAYFDNEVTPKVHAQNFSAAFNGGMFLSWLIPFVNSYDFQT